MSASRSALAAHPPGDLRVGIVDDLVGIQPDSPADRLRAARPAARFHTDASHEALFGPEAGAAVSHTERLALAAFVTGLHGDTPLTAAFDDALVRVDPALARHVRAAVSTAVTTGPYGRYPDGPLSRENTAGPVFRADAALRAALGIRLAAAFAHAHLLLFRPREASPAALQELHDTGWTPDGIVTLSQIVAFLSYEVRLVAGLRVLSSELKEPRQ